MAEGVKRVLGLYRLASGISAIATLGQGLLAAVVRPHLA